jgi:hypothetical protein
MSLSARKNTQNFSVKIQCFSWNLSFEHLFVDFEKYEVIDGVRVRCGNETKNWCGPINAGVTLVWKLF